jgi:hypothetical protein
MNDRARTASPWRALLWGVGALLLLVLLAWGALAVLFPPAKVRALVSAQLTSALSREVRFADASLSLWPPVRLTVSAPALAEPGGFGNGAAFQARSLHLDLDVWALLSRRVVVRRLVLDRPALHLVLNPDGTTNLDGLVKPQPAPQGKGGAAMDLAVRELRIQEGRVLVDDRKSSRRTAFGIESRISLAAEAGGERVATAGETVFSGLAGGPMSATRLSDLRPFLGGLDWRLAHDGKLDTKQKRLALARLTLGLGRAELGLSGVVDGLGPTPRVDLRARGEAIDLRPVFDFLAASDAAALHGIGGSGRLDFDLAIRGALGPGAMPRVSGTLTVADGALRYPGAPAGVEGLALTARFAPDTVAIGDARAHVAGQPVRAALFATRFADPFVRFAVQGNLDLAAIAPLVAPKDTKLGGRAAVNVQGSGRARDPGSLALSGGARLNDVSVQSPLLPNKVEGVRGEIQFSQSRASVTGFSARSGKSSIALDATVDRPLALMSGMPGMTPAGAGPGASGPATGRVAPATVHFNAASSYFDVADFLPTTPGAPVLPNATGEGRVTIARLRNQKLDVSDVRARVALEPGVLAVPEFAMHAYGGTALGTARFDLTDPARPKFAVKTQVDSLEADDLLSAWTPVKGLLHGSLGTTLNLSGEGATPADLKRTITAVGLALVADGTLGPGPALEAVARYTKIPALKQVRFKDARLPFRVEGGRVVTDPVTLKGPSGDWRLIGSAGFDGTLDYAVSGTLPPDVVEKLAAKSALAAGALADPEGRILLDLRVSGKVIAPQVSWDGTAMRDRLAGKASQALEAQRAKLEAEAQAAAQRQLAAAQDSARKVVERTQRAATDSLKRRAGDLLKGFFNSPRDTTQHR